MFSLDEIIVRTALIDARRYLSRGLKLADAADLACVGVWKPYRREVEQRLRTEQFAALSVSGMDEKAA
jgi:hypothetical protein